MEPLAGGRAGVYALSIPAGSWVAFQAGPNRIVFVHSSSKSKITHETMAKFADRTADNSPLSPEMREGISHVSGYENISASSYSGSRVRYVFGGSFTNHEGIRESYSMTICDTPEAARERMKTSEQHENKFAPEDKKAVGKLEVVQWVRGDRSFYFSRQGIGKLR